MFQECICVRWCFWSRLCACVCNDTREFSCVALYMLVYGWRALTEGHGSCTLSVWTLAEPLGVLFQARSDNLAPMTRLATAQFTGRSSTHAQPPPPPTPTSFSPSPHSLSVPPCTLLHLSTLLYPPSPLNFSQSLPSCCVFFFSQPLLFSLLSLFLWHCCQQDRNCLLASGRNRSCRPANGNRQAVFNTLTSWSSLWNEFLCGWNGRSGSFHNNNINPDLILRF